MKSPQVDKNNNPTIDPADVRRALDSLLYSTQPLPTDNPLFRLRQLTSVDYVIQVTSPIQQTVALNNLLTKTITTCYKHHRHRRNLPLPAADDTLAVAITHSQEDIQTTSIELICWSWLYHRYVRVDLDITPDMFTTMCGITRRTLRRYTQHGIWRLTQHLIQREQALTEQS